ncbi:hypothetical protein Golob_026201 [Gossypium lobatum]|uniref:Uncharacterized protein n=1 Tax=Gossypium lobatum TaxID=34289 RepID=A0A7J8LUC8_9ROSI|nr:hypothetical protein [Gossypium lobatum]
MELGLETMAAAIGVSVPVLRFLLCFVATIPVSFLWRFVPGTLPKHVYSAFSGVVLSYLSFGISSNLLFLVPMLLGYAAMLLYRPKCGIITFFLSFGYLIGCHVYYMSGDAWKEGGIDATVVEEDKISVKKQNWLRYACDSGVFACNLCLAAARTKGNLDGDFERCPQSV